MYHKIILVYLTILLFKFYFLKKACSDEEIFSYSYVEVEFTKTLNLLCIYRVYSFISELPTLKYLSVLCYLYISFKILQKCV